MTGGSKRQDKFEGAMSKRQDKFQGAMSKRHKLLQHISLTVSVLKYVVDLWMCQMAFNHMTDPGSSGRRDGVNLQQMYINPTQTTGYRSQYVNQLRVAPQ